MFGVPDGIDDVLADRLRQGLDKEAVLGVVLHSPDLFFQNNFVHFGTSD